MSSKQATLDTYVEDAADEATGSEQKTQSPEKTPDAEQTDEQPLDFTVEKDCKCLECGEPVTEQFSRTMGDNDGRVHACINCTDLQAIRRGAAADSYHNTGDTALFQQLQSGDRARDAR